MITPGFTIKIEPNGPCPCGSMVKAKKCCFRSRQLFKKPAVVTPPSPCTGFSNPKCFANADNDCSQDISREHFISETLLRQIELNGTAKIAGLKWQAPEEFNIVPIPRLAPKILCSRHNSALSPLDAAIGRFSQTIKDYDLATHPKASAQDDELRLFAGDDIESWILKCFIGGSFSKNLSRAQLKPECLDLLYGRIAWPAGWGLYMQAVPSAPIYHSDSFLFETLVGGSETTLLAARVTIRGLVFHLCLGLPSDPSAFGIWRPSHIIFRDQSVRKVIELSWSKAGSRQFVTLTRGGSYDGPPPDWQDWEKRK